MKLSIVATLYKSESHLVEFCERSIKAATTLVGSNFELILVNDGSPDNSLPLALKIREKYPEIVVVDLSRNFGHHKAMMTGLRHARGEKIFLIDSDLEEEPEWLHSFSEQMQKETCDVVYGVQAKRKGGFFERLSGQIFYKLLAFLSHEVLPQNITVARLMTKCYVKALIQHEEREIYIAGLWQLTGFDQRPQTVTKHSSSETTYTLRLKLSLFINSITSFSNTPLIAIFYIGLLIMLFASGYTAFLIIKKIFFHSIIEGWTSLMASLWLLGGLIILFIGVIGIYLSKIFIESKQRPYSIIRHIYRNSELSSEMLAPISEEVSCE